MKYVHYPIIDMKGTGENIRRIRISRNLGVKDIQQFLGLTTSHGIYLWQKGLTLPTVDHLCAISKLFDVPMDDIIVLKNTYPPKPCPELARDPMFPCSSPVAAGWQI